jgi:hypothetical protein
VLHPTCQPPAQWGRHPACRWSKAIPHPNTVQPPQPRQNRGKPDPSFPSVAFPAASAPRKTVANQPPIP